ncbi:unnamed protein product [Protopolystoma xenopodis]|uniref:Uncharacterized protein n=1 Tax=Protopolystoma xenopodis TaxID=117903 RepID=A0A3S5FEN8_9PLAT|nr:unnamed protein product [Protopolystoma xenopodis]
MSYRRPFRGRSSRRPFFERLRNNEISKGPHHDNPETKTLGDVLESEFSIPSNESNEFRLKQAKSSDTMDRRMGFEPFTGPGDQVGWLFTMQPTDILDPDSKRLVSGVDFYFIKSDGCRFKASNLLCFLFNLLERIMLPFLSSFNKIYRLP